jgi:hypothetical protein
LNPDYRSRPREARRTRSALCCAFVSFALATALIVQSGCQYGAHIFACADKSWAFEQAIHAERSEFQAGICGRIARCSDAAEFAESIIARKSSSDVELQSAMWILKSVEDPRRVSFLTAHLVDQRPLVRRGAILWLTDHELTERLHIPDGEFQSILLERDYQNQVLLATLSSSLDSRQGAALRHSLESAAATEDPNRISSYGTLRLRLDRANYVALTRDQ